MHMTSEAIQNSLQEISLEIAFIENGSEETSLTLNNGLEKLIKSLDEAKASKSIKVARDMQNEVQHTNQKNKPVNSDLLSNFYLQLEKKIYEELNTEQSSKTSIKPVHEEIESIEKDEEDEIFVLKIEDSDDIDLLTEFCTEGRDLLAEIEQGILVLEENPNHKETLNVIFRAFHTFKGGAGFLGLGNIKDLAHILESLLDKCRQGELTINHALINSILSGSDKLQQLIANIESSLKRKDNSITFKTKTIQLIEKVSNLMEGIDVDDPERHPEPAQIEEEGPLKEEETSVTNIPDQDVITVTTEQDQEPLVAPKHQEKQQLEEPKARELKSFVKIKTEKLDELIDLVGELVIAKSMVEEHPSVANMNSGDFSLQLRQLSRISTELQRTAMSLRMVPIRNTFRKMNRLVRDLSSTQNKQVQLVLKGEETELDRNIVEALVDPLIHMLRNSIDHGLELAEERESVGKESCGTITLEACHQGGGILIKVEDDGRGIDSEKVLSKARENGIVTDDFNGGQTDALELIFVPGFSTAQSVTDISGRGVGMDVVRENIAKLRGRLSIKSTVGKGTTFCIYLPLTLAIIDGLLIGVGKQRFIMPTLSIKESFKPIPGILTTVKGKKLLANLRGKLIPIIKLSEKLGIQGGIEKTEDGIVLIINSSGQEKGLLVDRLINKQEVVIKAVGDTLKQQPLYSGAAVLGDGRAALILDPDQLGKPELKLKSDPYQAKPFN